MTPAEPEGVIKYQLDFRLAETGDYPQFAELNGWRTILMQLGLIGQEPSRYGGLGFGNISFRLDNSASFVITGSQTGALKQLSKTHFSTVLSVDTARNHILAEGETKPSSEALTHAAVYKASNKFKAVVHAHSPDIWRNHAALNLAAIPKDIPYGTPEMAAAVAELFATGKLNAQPVFVMLGHEDGVIAYGHSITGASLVLVRLYAKALTINFGAG